MNNQQKQNLKDRLLRLIRLRCTGTPAELAVKLGISERSIKRMIGVLRDEGMEINYSPSRRSYIDSFEYS